MLVKLTAEYRKGDSSTPCGPVRQDELWELDDEDAKRLIEQGKAIPMTLVSFLAEHR